MSFALKEELNELVMVGRCCSAATLWVLTLSHLSTIEGVDILHEPYGSNIGGSSLSSPIKSAPQDVCLHGTNIMSGPRATFRPTDCSP